MQMQMQMLELGYAPTGWNQNEARLAATEAREKLDRWVHWQTFTPEQTDTLRRLATLIGYILHD